jgi:hypothetical protein
MIKNKLLEQLANRKAAISITAVGIALYQRITTKIIPVCSKVLQR